MFAKPAMQVSKDSVRVSWSAMSCLIDPSMATRPRGLQHCNNTTELTPPSSPHYKDLGVSIDNACAIFISLPSREQKDKNIQQAGFPDGHPL